MLCEQKKEPFFWLTLTFDLSNDITVFNKWVNTFTDVFLQATCGACALQIELYLFQTLRQSSPFENTR